MTLWLGTVINGYDRMKPSLTSISIEKPLLDRARKVAKARRQSFSAYVATLIEIDIRNGAADQKARLEAA